MRPFVYDTNIFVYAVGGQHPLRDPCRAVIERARTGRLAGHASPDLLQEFVHHRARRTRDRAEACSLAEDVARMCTFDDLREADARRALALFVRYERLTARDAVFAAFALNRQIPHVLSVDGDFDGVDGLTRIDPADAAAVDALTR